MAPEAIDRLEPEFHVNNTILTLLDETLEFSG